MSLELTFMTMKTRKAGNLITCSDRLEKGTSASHSPRQRTEDPTSRPSSGSFHSGVTPTLRNGCEDGNENIVLT